MTNHKLLNNENRRHRPLTGRITWLDRFLSVYKHATAAASVEVEGFVAAKVFKDLGLLLQGGAFGFAGKSSLDY